MNTELQELIESDEELQALLALGYTIEEDTGQATTSTTKAPAAAHSYPADLKIY